MVVNCEGEKVDVDFAAWVSVSLNLVLALFTLIFEVSELFQ